MKWKDSDIWKNLLCGTYHKVLFLVGHTFIISPLQDRIREVQTTIFLQQAHFHPGSYAMRIEYSKSESHLKDLSELLNQGKNSTYISLNLSAFMSERCLKLIREIAATPFLDFAQAVIARAGATTVDKNQGCINTEAIAENTDSLSRGVNHSFDKINGEKLHEISSHEECISSIIKAAAADDDEASNHDLEKQDPVKERSKSVVKIPSSYDIVVTEQVSPIMIFIRKSNTFPALKELASSSSSLPDKDEKKESQRPYTFSENTHTLELDDNFTWNKEPHNVDMIEKKWRKTKHQTDNLKKEAGGKQKSSSQRHLGKVMKGARSKGRNQYDMKEEPFEKAKLKNTFHKPKNKKQWKRDPIKMAKEEVEEHEEEKTSEQQRECTKVKLIPQDEKPSDSGLESSLPPKETISHQICMSLDERMKKASRKEKPENEKENLEEKEEREALLPLLEAKSMSGENNDDLSDKKDALDTKPKEENHTCKPEILSLPELPMKKDFFAEKSQDKRAGKLLSGVQLLEKKTCKLRQGKQPPVFKKMGVCLAKSKPAEALVMQEELEEIAEPRDFLSQFCTVNICRIPIYERMFSEATKSYQQQTMATATKKNDSESETKDCSKNYIREESLKNLNCLMEGSAGTISEGSLLTPLEIDQIKQNILLHKGRTVPQVCCSAPEKYLQKLEYIIKSLEVGMNDLQNKKSIMEGERQRRIIQMAKVLYPNATEEEFCERRKDRRKKQKLISESDTTQQGWVDDFSTKWILSKIKSKMMKKIEESLSSYLRNADKELTILQLKLDATMKKLDSTKSERVKVKQYCHEHSLSQCKKNQMSSEFRREQSLLYNKLHPDPDLEMKIDDLEDTLQKVNHNLTTTEINYIYHILDIPGCTRINFHLFCVIAALSEKVDQLEPFIKDLINKMDLEALDIKLSKCKEMFAMLVDERNILHEGVISVSNLAIELVAGGIPPEDAEQKMGIVLWSKETGDKEAEQKRDRESTHIPSSMTEYYDITLDWPDVTETYKLQLHFWMNTFPGDERDSKDQLNNDHIPQILSCGVY